VPRIREMYAFVVEDTGPDDEGVIGMDTMKGWVPFVGADVQRVDDLRVSAQTIATMLKKPVKVLRWTQEPEVMEVIEPE
jgi:hypothetical protein